MTEKSSNVFEPEIPPLFTAKRDHQVIPYAEIISDFFCFFFGVTGGYVLYGLLMARPLPGGFLPYAQLAFFSALTGVISFYAKGLYYHQASIMNLLETRKLIHIVFFLFLILILYSFFTNSPYSRITLYLDFVLVLTLLLINKFLFFKIYQNNYLRGIGVRNILIIGAGSTGRLLFQSLSHTPKLGYYPVGFFEPEAGDRGDINDLQPLNHKRKILMLTNFTQCIDYISQHRIDTIIITKPLPDNYNEKMQSLVSVCRREQIQLQTIPYMLSLFAENVQLHDVNGIPLISCREIRDNVWEQFLKRCLDLGLTTLLIPVIFPLMAIIALLIKLDSRGPVIFRQQRVGKNGTPFIVYKFRTMFTDAPVFKSSPSTSDDTRITRIGKILRKISLDELPQFLNVLEGSMSLVGPRPEMEFIVKNEYNELYRQRLRVKPGITGVWQISADRKREIHEDISYDLFYIAHHSLLLDILILLRTIPALFFMRTY